MGNLSKIVFRPALDADVAKEALGLEDESDTNNPLKIDPAPLLGVFINLGRHGNQVPDETRAM